jgi:1,4-alpha-glucan branching enzyme
MKTGTMVQYAEMRTKNHINRFNRLYHDIKENNIDEGWLKDVEYMDNIFPELDYSVYTSI